MIDSFHHDMRIFPTAQQIVNCLKAAQFAAQVSIGVDLSFDIHAERRNM
jgi:hypothetical protein